MASDELFDRRSGRVLPREDVWCSICQAPAFEPPCDHWRGPMPSSAEEWYEVARVHAKAAMVAHSIRPEDAKQRWIELIGIAIGAIRWIDKGWGAR